MPESSQPNNNNNDATATSATQEESNNNNTRGGIRFGDSTAFVEDVGLFQGGSVRKEEYVTELTSDPEDNNNDNDDVNQIDEGRVDASHPSTARNRRQITNDTDTDNADIDIRLKELQATSGSGLVNTRVSDRESEYQKRRMNRMVREDGLTYKESMQHANLEKERYELVQELQQQQQQQQESESLTFANNSTRKKRRWDSSSSSTGQGGGGGEEEAGGAGGGNNLTTTTPGTTALNVVVTDTESVASSSNNKKNWDDDTTTTSTTTTTKKRRKRWDETPVVASAATTTTTTTLLNATPLVTGGTAASVPKWDETPLVASGSAFATSAATPLPGATTSRWDATPLPAGASTSSTTSASLTKADALAREMESRNRPWTESALDAILPSEGYTILRPPSNYIPLRTPGRKLLLATPTPLSLSTTTSGFQMQVPVEQRPDATLQEIRQAYGVPLLEEGSSSGNSDNAALANLPPIKPDDMQYFGRLLQDTTTTSTTEKEIDKEELKERQIMTLLLKIKSGTPPQRKTAMRQITDKARYFGAGPLFHQILPLLMSPTLEDQERHLLVKVIDRVLYKLDDLVRPYVHRILAVIEPLLIDEDYYARVEGREIISNLAKAAGLATMIATMRPDIDSPDEYVRNTTSRAFAVVASALGIPALLPFLKAVVHSRKSWHARHTGIKIVQQIALLMGVAVLPYLQELVDAVSHGLTDDIPKVKIITALTCAALAEAAHPYGIESFDSVIRPLWKGATMELTGKSLAAFLKAIGFIIPLMEEQYASHYTKLIMPILLREFHSPDEEMKRIVLKVIQQCVATAGVEPDYIRQEILPEFFRNFWIRRMALDRRNYNQVIETTEELANKVGCSDIIVRVVQDLKDDSEPYRRMVMETVQRVLNNLGASDMDERLEEQLIDGMLYAFQEQAVDSSIMMGANAASSNKESQVMLDGFGTVVNALGERCQPYLKQIAGTIKWRLNNKAASVRMQAADLIGRIAVVMKACGEDQLMGHLGVVLYEYLGEEYPEVLGSILGALRAIVNVIGMTKMTPPIRDLLPRLTPILRNRHEKVQENVIDLVGRIADRGAEFVSAKEWMRICFELLELVRAHKKAIRRAAVSTFGFIAKAIGPQDVLHTLLNNLKVQDRQMRVCTTVAIAIVAETCGPFTVLPAVMNEYRVPELNVQNGVLKALSFMFEYIGPMGRDYVYAVAPLLEDALMERDPVHRQTACATVKHFALGVAGCGCEDVLIHLLNLVWPNIFEESPHVIQAVFDAIQGLMVALGPNLILQYVLQGLYHPARKVREVYWRVYNCLYIYNSDALVAGYPRIEDEGDNTYARTSLELFI